MTERDWSSPGRRRFLHAALAGTAIGLSGCTSVIGGENSSAGGSTDSDSGDAETPTITMGVASDETASTTDEPTASDSSGRSSSTRPVDAAPTGTARPQPTAIPTLTPFPAEQSTPTPTPTETATSTPTETATPAPQTTQPAGSTPTPEPADVENLAYFSPANDLGEYADIVTNRKREALRVLLGVKEVGTLVDEAVSSTAYHRILEDIDYLEVLAPHEMTVESSGAVGGGDPDDPFTIASDYDVTYADIKHIQALVDRRTDELLKLDVGRWTPSERLDWSYDSGGLEPARISLADERVQNVLEDKNWYLAASGQSPYAAYSRNYPIDSLSLAWFNWNDNEGQFVALHTIVDVDNEEVLAVLTPPNSATPQPLSGIVSNLRDGDESTSLDGVTRGSITPPGDMSLVDRDRGTISANDWEVTWTDKSHDAYGIQASYKGKPVFGPSTLVPYMFSDYAPFGTIGPGVPAGTSFTHHFWDPLGVTGPGVVEHHDLGNGFRLRGTFHSGSYNRWEWRFGQNFGPYRYVVDWSFYDDGTAVLTSRHPTTGYRKTNGFPKYTYHVAVEPAFENATASAYTGDSWESVATESKFERSEASKIRVENADGPERVVFDRPGKYSYLLQYDPELVEYEQNADGLRHKLLDHQKYLDPDNYLRGRSIDGNHLQVRTFDDQKTSEGPYATVTPFNFTFVMRAENY